MTRTQRIASFSTFADTDGSGTSLKEFTLKVTLEGYSNGQHRVCVHDKLTDTPITDLTSILLWETALKFDEDTNPRPNEVFILETEENRVFVSYLRKRPALFTNTGLKIPTSEGEYERWFVTDDLMARYWRTTSVSSGTGETDALSLASRKIKELERQVQDLTSVASEYHTFKYQSDQARMAHRAREVDLEDKLALKDRMLQAMKRIAHRRYEEIEKLEKIEQELTDKLRRVKLAISFAGRVVD